MDRQEEEALEQRIREKAHQLWQQEGCPPGQADRHWQAARQLLAIETEADATLIPVEESFREASEPISVVEAQGDVPGLTDQGEKQQYPSSPGRGDWPER